MYITTGTVTFSVYIISLKKQEENGIQLGLINRYEMKALHV